MNICVVGSYFPPDIGANSTQAWNLSSILSKFGHEVMVLTVMMVQGNKVRRCRGYALRNGSSVPFYVSP
jgi:hypothetical protein